MLSGEELATLDGAISAGRVKRLVTKKHYDHIVPRNLPILGHHATDSRNTIINFRNFSCRIIDLRIR